MTATIYSFIYRRYWVAVVLLLMASGTRAIDMSGIVEATSLVEQNGEIVLQGGDEGDVRVTGTLDASAS